MGHKVMMIWHIITTLGRYSHALHQLDQNCKHCIALRN